MASDPVLSRQQMIAFCEQKASEFRHDGSKYMSPVARRSVAELAVPYEAIAQALQKDWQTAALLKDRTRAAIRDRRQAGESIQDLAKDYGVPEAFVEALCAWQFASDAALVPRLQSALTQLFYIFSRDYDVSGDDFRDVIEHHIEKATGKQIRFSDACRETWATELAKRFIEALLAAVSAKEPDR